MGAIKLNDSVVKRGGRTAPYMDSETKNIEVFSGKGGAHIRFSIASKGGGITDISVDISHNDLIDVLLYIADSDSTLCETFGTCASKSSARLLKRQASVAGSIKNLRDLVVGKLKSGEAISNETSIEFTNVFRELESAYKQR